MPWTNPWTNSISVRLQLHALAYNLGNFLRTLATPEPIKNWSRPRLITEPSYVPPGV